MTETDFQCILEDYTGRICNSYGDAMIGLLKKLKDVIELYIEENGERQKRIDLIRKHNHPLNNTDC